jgi:hypothetical protein
MSSHPSERNDTNGDAAQSAAHDFERLTVDDDVSKSRVSTFRMAMNTVAMPTANHIHQPHSTQGAAYMRDRAPPSPHTPHTPSSRLTGNLNRDMSSIAQGYRSDMPEAESSFNPNKSYLAGPSGQEQDSTDVRRRQLNPYDGSQDLSQLAAAHASALRSKPSALEIFYETLTNYGIAVQPGNSSAFQGGMSSTSGSDQTVTPMVFTQPRQIPLDPRGAVPQSTQVHRLSDLSPYQPVSPVKVYDAQFPALGGNAQTPIVPAGFTGSPFDKRKTPAMDPRPRRRAGSKFKFRNPTDQTPRKRYDQGPMPSSADIYPTDDVRAHQDQNTLHAADYRTSYGFGFESEDFTVPDSGVAAARYGHQGSTHQGGYRVNPFEKSGFRHDSGDPFREPFLDFGRNVPSPHRMEARPQFPGFLPGEPVFPPTPQDIQENISDVLVSPITVRSFATDMSSQYQNKPQQTTKHRQTPLRHTPNAFRTHHGPRVKTLAQPEQPLAPDQIDGSRYGTTVLVTVGHGKMFDWKPPRYEGPTVFGSMAHLWDDPKYNDPRYDEAGLPPRSARSRSDLSSIS